MSLLNDTEPIYYLITHLPLAKQFLSLTFWTQRHVIIFSFMKLHFMWFKSHSCLYFVVYFILHHDILIVYLQWCTSFKYTEKWFSYTYTYVRFFSFFSQVVYYKILTRVPCAIQIGPCWLSILYTFISVYMVNYKLLIHSSPSSPFPLVTLNLFLMSAIIGFLFCK